MKHHSASKERFVGFTLIELLVAMAIIAILVALLLPAVQMAREAARKAQCRNNLKQIGLALHLYHDANRVFPPGGFEWRPFNNTTNKQLAWSAFILPFLEQGNLHATLDFNTPFDSPQNAQGAATIVPIYVCPTGSRGNTLVNGRGPIDYGGMFGERISSPNNPPKGMLIYDRVLRMSDASDGTSSTIIVGEDSRSLDAEWINARNIFDQGLPINEAPPVENDLRSDHAGGGAFVLLTDGAVRFLSENMDLDTLAALCTRAGREVIGEF